MRFQHILFIFIFSIVFTGCSSCEEATPNKPKNTDNQAATNLNKNTNENTNVNTNTNQGNNINKPASKKGGSLDADLQTVPKDTEKVEAVTLKPVIEFYCDAMRRKDDAGLRKVFTKETLAALEKDMNKEGLKSIAEVLELEPVGQECEVVNETINGDTAEATVITQTYPDGVSLTFEKVSNQWKMTRKSADFERVDNQ